MYGPVLLRSPERPASAPQAREAQAGPGEQLPACRRIVVEDVHLTPAFVEEHKPPAGAVSRRMVFLSNQGLVQSEALMAPSLSRHEPPPLAACLIRIAMQPLPRSPEHGRQAGICFAGVSMRPARVPAVQCQSQDWQLLKSSPLVCVQASPPSWDWQRQAGQKAAAERS